MCGRHGGLLAGLCTEQIEAVMLGKTAIVTAKHSTSEVLCHRIRHSSSLTGATLHNPFQVDEVAHIRGIVDSRVVNVEQILTICGLRLILSSISGALWTCMSDGLQKFLTLQDVQESFGRKTFVKCQGRQQPASHCWRPSANQLLLASQLLEAGALHPQQVSAQRPGVPSTRSLLE